MDNSAQFSFFNTWKPKRFDIYMNSLLYTVKYKPIKPIRNYLITK